MNKVDQLVSIVVISYNSSEFIIDTLESILKQDYSNLELIISDDCSKDNTVTLVENWLIENKKYFSNTLVLTSDTNLGTSKNLSRGCKNARGKWVKPVPGDDILLSNAIREYVEFAEENNCEIVYSKIKKIKGNTISKESYPINNVLFNKNSEEQYDLLINGAPFYSPTEFYSKEFLERMNYFDYKYKLIEDFPFLVKATKSGVNIFFINEALMLYRVSENSTSNSDSRKLDYINKAYFDDLMLIYKDILSPSLNIHNFIGIIDQKIKLIRMRKTLDNNNTKYDFDRTRWMNLFNPKFILLKIGLIKQSE